MRSIFAVALLIALNAPADAATVDQFRAHHHSVLRVKRERFRAPHVIVPLGQGATPRRQFAVPGWTDDETRRWLDGASAEWSQA